MTAASVSVVIPAFNAAAYIAEALRSVAAQTVSPAEVVVADDGSTDASANISRAFPGVTVLRLAHRGVSAARNAAVARTSGAFIAFLDADDVWDRTKLEKQLAFAVAHPDAGVIVARQSYCFEGPVPPWFRGPRDGSSEPGFQPSNWLVRRKTWEQVGPFDERLTHSEDTDWLARASDCGVQVASVDEPLVVHRIHGRNASGLAVEVREGVLAALRASVRRKREAIADA